MSVSRPPLSIAIAATQPWPAARVCLDSLYAQARPAGSQIIVAVPTGFRADVAGQACISYKRRELPAAYPAIGIVESHHKALLAGRGGKFVADGRIAVAHVQSFGFPGSCFIHYHEGRTVAGFHLARIPPRARLFGIAKCLALPLRVAVATARITARTIVRNPRHLRPALASFPLVAVLLSCHIAGELFGYLFGPG